MIITGWIPVVVWKLFRERKQLPQDWEIQDGEMDQKIENDSLPE
jgi:hypothetical protein